LCIVTALLGCCRRVGLECSTVIFCLAGSGGGTLRVTSPSQGEAPFRTTYTTTRQNNAHILSYQPAASHPGSRCSGKQVRFQMIYCRKGRVEVVYEGQGPSFTLYPGDCVLQPPGIRHRVLQSAEDLEAPHCNPNPKHCCCCCCCCQDRRRCRDTRLTKRSVCGAR
jgi:quercetin dioxygenase-like cupin family protein